MTRQRCHVRRHLKVECQYETFLSLTYILVTKKIPTNVSVSGNAKTSSSQPRDMLVGLANTGATGKKRKSEPQVSISTPTRDTVQALLLPPKKKMKASIEPSQPSSTTTVTERIHGALSKTKKVDNGAKKRPTHDESDDVPASTNLTHPAKKSKVEKPAAITRVPIRRSGKIFLIF